jgi:hypothetical protein
MDYWQGFLSSLPFSIHTDGPLPWKRLWLSCMGMLIAQAGARSIIEGRRYRPHREWISHCLWAILQVFYFDSWYWPNVTWFILDAMTVVQYRRWITHHFDGNDRIWRVRAICEGGFVLCWLVTTQYYTWFYVQIIWGLIWSPVAFALTYVDSNAALRRLSRRKY